MARLLLLGRLSGTTYLSSPHLRDSELASWSSAGHRHRLLKTFVGVDITLSLLSCPFI